MKLKKLSSMKGKRRYIIFKIHSDMELDFDNVKNAIWNSLSNWLGEADLGKADVDIIRNLWSRDEYKGFVRCNSKYVDAVKVGLSLIHHVGDSKVIFQTLRVSGTIKSGKKV
ncbi:MAG: Rpp14/Pop5 family protein [archaeon]